jgi:hypothetical protein
MADFLTRLVGRTLGMTPTVQPVLTPMFALEPVGPDGGRDTDRGKPCPYGLSGPTQGISRSAIPPMLDGESANDPASPRATAVLPGGERSMVPSAGETFSEHAKRQAQDTAPTMHIHPQPTEQNQTHADLPLPLAQQQAHIDREHTSAIKSPILRRGEEGASGDQSPPGLSRTGASPVPTMQGAGQTMGQGRGGASSQSEQGMDFRTADPDLWHRSPGADLGRKAARREARPLQGPEDRSDGGKPHPQQSPYSYNDLQGRIEVASASAEPTIQVTIGRIEVRAMPPVAPAAPVQRKKPAVMGLEEYLEQRARGGRG